MVEVITSGRTDIDRFFEISGYLSNNRLNHHPYLVFIVCTKSDVLDPEIKHLAFELSHAQEVGDDDSSWAKSSYDSDKRYYLESKKKIPGLKKQLKELSDQRTADEVVEVKVIDNTDDLLRLPNDTKVMQQWGGQWSSDFMKFTVGDVRKYLKSKGGEI